MERGQDRGSGGGKERKGKGREKRGRRGKRGREGNVLEVVVLKPQRLAPPQIIYKTLVALLSLSLVRIPKVNQVTPVRQYMLGIVPQLLHAVFKERCGRGGEGGRGPFALGFEEEGEGVGAVGGGVSSAVRSLGRVGRVGREWRRGSTE